MNAYKKRIIVITSLLISVVVVALLVLNLAKRNQKDVGIGADTSKVPFMKNNIGNEGLSKSDVKDLLFEKSMMLFVSLSKTDDLFKSDPVYKNLSPGLMEGFVTSVTPLNPGFKIEARDIVVNSDLMSGAVNLKISNNAKELNVSLIYAKNAQSEWKLINYFLNKPVLHNIDE